MGYNAETWGQSGIYCPNMKGLFVLACFAFFAVANGHQKLVKSEQCDGTICPAGCCPEQNWFCCPDNMYCAATAADCPFVAMKEKLVKMAAKKQCDGTMCPAGCCPEANWFCCPDNMYRAATAADCPFVAKKAQLMKMAKNRQCGPDETSCPAGCCPEANWFCCPDNMYCAATAADCPFRAVSDYLSKLAKLN